ncbi:uncharacterized protein LOC101894911 [Musca domestica]|uniref:Uncharacterized protein LOC101894911 n=1 Tax=Musca domestica TaxID=7370 RepID=A0A1I8MZD7_MUSDO|nr:uncharacterized protein LOC101894911 [Musca domestica]
MSSPLVPTLLNEARIVRALCEAHKTTVECIEIKACDFKLSSANGENFCSDIYEVDVNYEINGNAMQKSFILKLMIPEIAEIGTNEQLMFTEVLPVMEGYLNTVEGKGTDKLFAKCFLTERQGKHEFYLLENLNTLGYMCGDRVKGLNEVEGHMVMQKIAKYHAASILYQKEFPDIVDSLEKSHFAKGAADVVAEAIAFGGFEYVANMIEKWPGYQHLAPRLLNLKNGFNDLVKQVVDPSRSTLNVITHGDLWVNNMLFKYDKDTQNPLDVVFVDFQNTFWGSCGFDLNYFLYTSLELPVLQEKKEDLLQTYCEALRKALVESRFEVDNIPSLDDVLAEVKHCELIALYVSLCELPIIALDKTSSKHFTLETFENPEEMSKMRTPMYANQRVKDNLLYTLKCFEESGLL